MHAALRNPTAPQARAGNYKKGHIRIHGLPVTIETARGKMRRGIGADGEPWEVKMPADYGYVCGTEGADGDCVDCYIGPHIKAPKVFVIDQVDAATGAFDEHKAMLGFASSKQAMNIYARGFSDGKGKDRIGSISEMSVEAFKRLLDKGDLSKPAKGQQFAAGGRVGYAGGGGINDWVTPKEPNYFDQFDPPTKQGGAPPFDPAKPYDALPDAPWALPWGKSSFDPDAYLRDKKSKSGADRLPPLPPGHKLDGKPEDWSAYPAVELPDAPWVRHQRSDGTAALKAAFASGAKPNDDAVRRAGVLREVAAVPRATATDAALSGATMGWSDEALAAATAPIDALKNDEPLSEAYSNNLARERERLARYRQENPRTAFAAEVAGGLAMMPHVAGGKLVASAPGIARRLAEGVGFGATTGAISGAGHADGDLDARQNGGKWGSIIGGSTGAVLPIAMAAARAFAAPISSLIKGVANPEARAVDALRRDLARDNISPAMARAELDAASAAGSPMTIADLGGRNTMGLARAVATGKGEGSARFNMFLDARRLDAPERVIDNVRTSLATPEAFYPTIERIIAERQAVAAPLYRRAYETPITTTPAVRSVLSTPAGQKAVTDARRLLANEGADGSLIYAHPQSQNVGPRNLADVTADVRGLDLVKRAFDDMIEVGQRQGARNDVRIMTTLKDRLVREIDRQAPAYKAARQAFSSRKELEDAIEQGRSFLKPGIDSETAITSIRAMSPAEREVARIGMAREIKGMFDDPSRTLASVNRLLNSDRMRSITREIFETPRSFETFRSGLMREAQLLRRGQQVQGNSATANKLADMEDAGFAGAAVDAVTGHPLRAGLKTLSRIGDRLRHGLNERTANKLGEFFSETDPARQRAVLDALERVLPPGGVDRLLGLLGPRFAEDQIRTSGLPTPGSTGR